MITKAFLFMYYLNNSQLSHTRIRERRTQLKLNRTSLSETIDSVNEAFFFGQPVANHDRDEIAEWIASRQGLPGSYAQMFAPTPSEAKHGIRLFTGETIVPSASLRHVSGEEASRALVLLKSPSKLATTALERATNGMREALTRAASEKRELFCCGRCDPALWRHISAGGLKGEEDWIERGLRALKSYRDGAGKWRRFQFYYTLLALSDLDSPAAKREMSYTATVCERYLNRSSRSGLASDRRRAIVERVLAKC